MNIFFYSAGNSACKNGCHYSICSQRCVYSLRKLSALRNVKVLPGGAYFTTPESKDIRSGDLIILYAGDKEELQELVANREIFEAFKIVLIVGEHRDINDGTCHHLKPRYITSLGKDEAELNAVIEKMAGAA